MREAVRAVNDAADDAEHVVLCPGMVNDRGYAGWFGAGGVVLGLFGSAPAYAQVKQTDAVQTPLPQPVGTAEMNLVNESWAWNASTQIIQSPQGETLDPPVLYGSYYAPPNYAQFVTGDAITLSGLFKWRGETIDPVQDAKTAPGHFDGKYGFTAQLLLMGSNCQVKFGWYNVTDPLSKTPPAKTEIYPFVPEATSSLNCTQDDGVSPKTDGFCPLAWDNRGPRQLDKIRWTPRVFSSGDITKDTHYLGGDVAFAVIGAAAGNCTQSKYSMYEHNQRNAQNVPWVSSLIYHSTIDPRGYYLAFEDAAMPADDWTSSGADGDFNDLVYYVTVGAPPSDGTGGNGGTAGTSGAGGGASAGNAGTSNAGNAGTSSAGTSGAGTSGGAATSAGASDGGTNDVAEGGIAGTDGHDDTAGEPSAPGGALSAAGATATGGTAAHGGANSTAGASARGGAAAESGATTTGGVAVSDAAAPASSSCGCAVPGERESKGALPVLALLFGFAFTRRALRKNAK